MNKQQAIKNLEDFYEVLDFSPVILDGGTLLGAYRDKDFCEDDWNDIDLTTYKENFYNIESFKKKMIEKGFEIKKEWKPEDKKTAQLVFKRNGCKIDLMFKDFKNEKAWWCVYKYKGDKDLGVVYKAVDRNFYENLEVIEFYGMFFKRPKKIKKYLRTRYGNWKIPIHRKNYSCYTTDLSIKNCYEEI